MYDYESDDAGDVLERPRSLCPLALLKYECKNPYRLDKPISVAANNKWVYFFLMSINLPKIKKFCVVNDNFFSLKYGNVNTGKFECFKLNFSNTILF